MTETPRALHTWARAAASVDFPAPLRPLIATKTERCDDARRAIKASTSGCAICVGVGSWVSGGLSSASASQNYQVDAPHVIISAEVVRGVRETEFGLPRPHFKLRLTYR